METAVPDSLSPSAAKLGVKPLAAAPSFRSRAYSALKQAITAMDIYGQSGAVRLDERRLSQELGVSRTPIREAMTLLEQEGFVRTLPRRGIFVVRKTKREIVEMITVWAALESMAARLATLHAADADIAQLRRLMDAFTSAPDPAHLGEYSQANIAFHQAIIRLGGCALLSEMSANLFLHMRAIRRIAIHQDNRAARSIVDHRRIIEAIERRDTEAAESLVRRHALDLAAHVERCGDFLEPDAEAGTATQERPTHSSETERN